MRFFARLIVLAFAGFGVYKAWELVEPKLSDARQRAAGARDKIEPAIRDAADRLHTATQEAADELSDGPSEAEQVAPDAFGDAAERIPAAPELAT